MYQFFAKAGFPCPPLGNPSDHFLRCINNDFDKVKATLRGSMKLRFERTDDPLERVTTAEATMALTASYKTSPIYHSALAKIDEISRVKGTILQSGGSQTSFLMQTFTLTKRSFVTFTPAPSSIPFRLR